MATETPTKNDIDTAAPLTVNSQNDGFFVNLSRIIGLFLVVEGIVVLIGWALDVAAFKSIVPGLATMKCNTAILFLLAGVSLWFRNKEPLTVVSQIASATIALLSVLTLAQYVTGSNFGIDQFFFKDNDSYSLNPGRMAPSSALNFFLTSIALLLPSRAKSIRLSQAFLIVVFAIAYLAFLGYLFGVSVLYTIGIYTSMSLHTSISFLILSLAIMFSRPQTGIMRDILAGTAGGQILRRFVPVILTVPPIMGWVRWWGEKIGLYDTAFGLALMVSSLVAMLSILVWVSAYRLTRLDFKRKKGDQDLHESETRFRATLEGMIEGCQIIGFDWRYLYLNNAAVEHSQTTREALLGKTMMECYPGIENTQMFDSLRLCMAQRSTTQLVNEFSYPDGTKGWFELSVQPAPDGIFILSSDITPRKHAENAVIALNEELEVKIAQRTVELSAANEELKKLSLEDALTGLHNRRSFMLLAEDNLKRAKRSGENLLLFYCDLDGLKTINDQKGHTAGDEAIKTAAQALRDAFRTSDVIARLGGDEFVVLATKAAEQDSQAPISRLQSILESKQQSMSVGVVTISPQNEVPLSDLMVGADAAMYAEKRKKPIHR